MFFITFVYAEKCKKRGYGIGIWAITYGIFRFFIEYLRDDYRGGVEGAALSPSQIQSIIFVVAGLAYFAIVFFLQKKGWIAESIDWTDELKAQAELKALKAEIKRQKRAEALGGENKTQTQETPSASPDTSDGEHDK